MAGRAGAPGAGAAAWVSADPGKLGWGGDSGTGTKADPNAGVATAHGLVGEQTPRLGLTELSGGGTAATMLGARTWANAGKASTALKAKRQAAARFTVFGS